MTYRIFVLALLLSAIGCGEGSNDAQPAPQPLTELPAVQNADRAWPELPAPPVEYGDDAPYIPRFVPYTDDLMDPRVAATAYGTKEHNLLLERFYGLVSIHPDTQVSRDLLRAVERGELFIGFVESPDFVAAYKVYLPDEVNPPEIREMLPERTHYPVLFVNPVMVATFDRPGSEFDAYALLLMIQHEYRHFLQSGGRWQPKPTTPELCRRDWLDEWEAYYESCQTAVAWGRRNFDRELCSRVGSDAAFDQALFTVFWEKGPGFGLERGCFETWAEMAGHPRPWAFAQ